MRVIVCTAYIFLLAAAIRAGDRPDADPAIATARKRQEAVRTAVIKYRETEIVPKGGKSELDPLFKHPEPIPAEEKTVVSINRLVIDADKIRIEDNHPLWHMPSGVLTQMRVLSVCNEDTAKTLYTKKQDEGAQSSGSIASGLKLETVKSVLLAPLTVSFRGLNGAITPYPVTELNFSGTTLPIDGVPCREYEVERGTDAKVRILLDTRKDYLIRRIRSEKQGKLITQTDVTGQQHAVVGWIPVSWVRNDYSPTGAVLDTVKVEILETEFNSAQPQEQFDLQFPPGALVYDKRKAKSYRVQEDGSMREFSTKGEELSGSVRQPGAPWYQGHPWLIGALAVVLSAAGIIYVLQRRRKTA